MSMSLAAKPTLIDRLVPSSLVADIAVIAGGAALTALAAQVQFTIGNNPVPFTLQTLSVLLVGTVLGSVRGLLSMALYVLAGLVMPVYSEGAHGINVLLGATGGYLFGFIVSAYLVGKLAELKWSSNVLKMAASYVLGMAVTYALGVTVLTFSVLKGDWSMGLQYGLYPFLAWDAVKAVVAAGLVPGAWALVKKVKGN
jgi:biotin transport system substrate-specific component